MNDLCSLKVRNKRLAASWVSRSPPNAKLGAVPHNLNDYEALARRLAGDPSLLGGFRNQLQNNRSNFPLFDSNRFCRHIEATYSKMWELFQQDQSPQSFGLEL